jgi:hypothetical protein
LSVERKDNSWGLGYDPGMGLSESLGGKKGAAAGGGGPKLSGELTSFLMCYILFGV